MFYTELLWSPQDLWPFHTAVLSPSARNARPTPAQKIQPHGPVGACWKPCRPCLCPLWLLPASLTVLPPLYWPSTFSHLPPWLSAGLSPSSAHRKHSKLIKWMNTELSQSHQSLPCRLGLQKKPTLVFPRKAFRGPESHVIFKEVWNGFSPNVAVIVQ